MKLEEYYFYPPKAPQFYFAKKSFASFKDFYTPYSFRSKLFWSLYRNSRLLRSFFVVTENKIPLPLDQFKRVLGNKGFCFFFNLGTFGVEQKATIVAINSSQQLFLKWAESEIARNLVGNEAKVLLELEEYDIETPRILNYVSNDLSAYFVTEIIKGEKLKNTVLNNDIMSLMISVTNSFPLKKGRFVESFSHGDFCSWNMLSNNTKGLILIDWEKAGFKSLGYDLFTFIFQTNFLLNSGKEIKKIIHENQSFINKYFKEVNIDNWQDYLINFAEIKILEEKKKEDSQLIFKYEELGNFYEVN